MFKTAASAVSLSLALISPSIAQSVCDAALVRATYNLSNRVGLDWRLADLVTQETYNEVKNSAGASAVIYGLPVGANYTDYKNRIDKLKKEYTEQLSYTQQLNVAWSGLDPKSENLYRDCLSAQILTTDGLHAVVVGATKNDIALSELCVGFCRNRRAFWVL
jgi:hypothetical protein